MSRHSPGTALLKRPSWDSGSQWLISLTTPSRLCWMESRTASSGTKAGRTSLADQLVPIVSPPRLSTRSEEHTSELQSLMRISYAVFCLKTTKHQPQSLHLYTLYQ